MGGVLRWQQAREWESGRGKYGDSIGWGDLRDARASGTLRDRGTDPPAGRLESGHQHCKEGRQEGESEDQAFEVTVGGDRHKEARDR